MFRVSLPCSLFLALSLGGAHAEPSGASLGRGSPPFPGVALLAAGARRPAAPGLVASGQTGNPGRTVRYGIRMAKHGLPWRDAGFDAFDRLEIFTPGGRHALTVWAYESASPPPSRMEPGLYFVRIFGDGKSPMRLLLIQ